MKTKKFSLLTAAALMALGCTGALASCDNGGSKVDVEAEAREKLLNTAMSKILNTGLVSASGLNGNFNLDSKLANEDLKEIVISYSLRAEDAAYASIATEADGFVLMVNNPEYQSTTDGYVTVELTLTLTLGESTKTKKYTVRIAEEPGPITIEEALEAKVNDRISVYGQVIAMTTNTFVIVDDNNHPYIAYQASSYDSDIAIGDYVKAKGTVTLYNFCRELAKGCSVVKAEKPDGFEIKSVDDAPFYDVAKIKSDIIGSIDSEKDPNLFMPIKITGTLNASGGYQNIDFTPATNNSDGKLIQGSTWLTSAQEKAFNGKAVDIYGYYMHTVSKHYVYVAPVKIVEHELTLEESKDKAASDVTKVVPTKFMHDVSEFVLPASIKAGNFDFDVSYAVKTAADGVTLTDNKLGITLQSTEKTAVITATIKEQGQTEVARTVELSVNLDSTDHTYKEFSEAWTDLQTLEAAAIEAKKTKDAASPCYIEAVIVDTPSADYCNFNIAVSAESNDKILVYGLYDHLGGDRFGSKRQISPLPEDLKQGATIKLYGTLEAYYKTDKNTGDVSVAYELVNAVLVSVTAPAPQGK